MEQARLVAQLQALSRELEQSLPHPPPREVERLIRLAAALAPEAGVEAPPPRPGAAGELEEAVSLLGAVAQANHPPAEIVGPLAHNQSLAQLFRTLWAIRDAALALSTGDLSVAIKSKGLLAGALKTLQAHFRHLTWQTQRVADGDFSQRVDFMGEFATAFNAMVRRLARTVEALRQKEAELTSKNQELEREIAHRREVEEALRESEKRYRELAMVDHLTGLYNRRHFYVLAENEIKRARRHGRDLALVMLDIDRFKQVNDRHGHDCGDKVLVELSRALNSLVRSGDICARFGGEEFVLLLPETHNSQALRLAERVRRTIAGSRVPSGGGWVGITVSLGVTDINNAQDRPESEPHEVLETLFKQADEALYASKKAGRNRVTSYLTDASHSYN